MQRPVQITSRDFQLTPAMEAHIRERADDLQLYFPRLTGCHVVVEAPVHHHRKGGPFKVRIDLRVPRAEISVNRQSADDLAIAIRDAFDAARRRLEDHLRELRRDVKAHELPSVGRVARIFPEEGYGFLETLGQPRDIFPSSQRPRRAFRRAGARNRGALCGRGG